MSERSNINRDVKSKDKENSKFPIKTVADNKEKGATYQVYMKRFNKAKESEFYLECLWILYAVIEDRATSFLYHIGFISANKRSVIQKKNIKADVREIFGMKPNENNYGLNNISGKIGRIKKLLTWCKEVHEALSDYQKALIKTVRPLVDSDEFNATLNYLETEWRDKRNQLAHALFNKNQDAVLVELRPLVEQGYNAARQLDTAVKKVKKKDIRLKFHIQ